VRRTLRPCFEIGHGILQKIAGWLVGTCSGGSDLRRVFDLRLAVKHLRIFRDGVKGCAEIYLQGGV
jgi:hypothetical protein